MPDLSTARSPSDLYRPGGYKVSPENLRATKRVSERFTTDVVLEEKPPLFLADAIRLGATFSPQATGEYHNPETGATCAIGAALFAAGRLDLADATTKHAEVIPNLHAELPWKFGTRDGDENPDEDLEDMIIRMNDEWNWSREQIADWIEAKGFNCALNCEPEAKC